MEEPKLANNSEKFTSIPSWLPAGQNFRQNELEFFFEMLNVSRYMVQAQFLNFGTKVTLPPHIENI